MKYLVTHYLVALFLSLLCFQQMNAQSLSLFGIDGSNFPHMKAKFYAYDASEKQQLLSMGDLTLTENTHPRTITSVTCPVPTPPKTLSTVLVIDISGSMKNASGSVKNIDIAKTAAYTWVRSLPLDASECAVTSFDNDNYLNQDFTTDVTELNTAISLLAPQRGTDYNAAFVTPMAGGLEISKNGRYKKTIIMLTDGQGGGNENAIISEAVRQGCTIYCVTIGLPAPTILVNIAGSTGGKVFDNIKTAQEIEIVYKKILDLVQGDGPCEITWDSKIQCNLKLTQVNLRWNAKNEYGNGTYSPPSNAISYLKINPSSISLKDVSFLSQTDTTITLTAFNDSMLVLGVVPIVGSRAFTLLDANFPRTIAQNSSTPLTLRFEPKDSSVQYASYLVQTPECSYTFSAIGSVLVVRDPTDSVYVPKKKNPPPTLKLTHPNGGETFVIGSDTVITWDGIASSDTVSLDYSIDSGKVWKNIITKTSGLEYKWDRIPAPASAQCLMRVSQLQEFDSIDINPSLVFPHPQNVSGVAFSPDGLFAATSGDSTAYIWDTDSGRVIQTFIGHTGAVNAIAYCQDGTSLITGSADSSAIVWNIPSGVAALTLRGHKGSINDVACSYTSNIIATASEDLTAKIWDMKSGKLIFDLKGHTGVVNGIALSTDGNRAATASSDKSIKIWDCYFGTLIKTLTGHKGYVYAVAFSPDGSKIGSVSNDNTAIIWDVFTGLPLITLNHSGLVTDIAFSPDGKQVITSSRDYYTKIWDIKTGAVVRILGGSSSFIKRVAFSPNGKRIITANNGKEAAVWDEQGPLQEDVSDSTFTIVAPQPAATDVAMGICSIGKTKDSTVTPFIWNLGSYPFRVKSIAIVGQDAAQFSLISGIPPVDIASSDSHSVEFRFRPTSLGVKTAQLLIYTQSDTLKRRITGEGVASTISILGKVIDFGKVLINTFKDTLQTVTIRNTSSKAITINATHHAGPNVVDYSTLAGGGSFTLMPGDTAKLDLRFNPKSPGRTSGRILFDYDGIDSPETVQLFGEGVKPGAQILAAGLNIPPIVCASETTDTLQIHNRGTDTLRVASATFTGVNSMDFQFVVPFVPLSLLPDSIIALPVKFTPNASGVKTALLELHSNSIVDSNLKLPITGRKEVIAFSTNIQKIDLGTMCPNETRDTAITLTNTGSLRSTYLVQSQAVTTGISDITLGTSDSAPIILRYPGRTSPGLIDEIITITDTVCGKQTTVQVIGTVQLPQLSYPPFVDFGAVAIGASKSIEILAINTDTRSIIIAPPQGINPPFTLLSLNPPLGNILASGDTLKIRLQYTAGSTFPSPQMITWSTSSPCVTLDSTELRVSGIQRLLTSVATVGFDSVCVGQSKSLKAILTNTGSAPLQLLRGEWITNTGSIFSAAVPQQIIAPGANDSIDIQFTPAASGVANADLRWIADQDTAFTTVSGIGKICLTNLDTARTTIVVPDITAKAGEKVNLTLTIRKSSGMQIAGAPTEWQASIHYNKSILFNEQTNNSCTGTTDSCALELTGNYNPKTDELISIPCILTLGNTDHASIIIDRFTWTNSTIVTEVATQNGTITITGVCENGGVRLFIPAKNSTSLATRPNPAQDNLQIQYGLREPLTVTLELLTMTGQVAQTIINNQAQATGEYTLTSDLSVLGNGVYQLRMRTNKEILTTRVDVVK